MHAHRTTVTVRADHEVVVHLPADFPPGEADVIVLPRPVTPPPQDAVAQFDRFLASLPTAPVISLDSLDRGELYR
jgi:hypothetical protein